MPSVQDFHPESIDCVRIDQRFREHNGKNCPLSACLDRDYTGQVRPVYREYFLLDDCLDRLKSKESLLYVVAIESLSKARDRRASSKDEPFNWAKGTSDILNVLSRCDYRTSICSQNYTNMFKFHKYNKDRTKRCVLTGDPNVSDVYSFN